jgi:hypothetical protein
VRALLHRRHVRRKLLHLLGGGRMRRLGQIIELAGKRIAKLDRVQQLARIAVRFEAPDRGDPQSRRVAIAVHEDDRQGFLGGRRGDA